MSLQDWEKEDLISEIYRLQEQLVQRQNVSQRFSQEIPLQQLEAEVENPEESSDEEENIEDDIDEDSFSEMFSSMMSFGGFDLQNIQFDFLNVMIGNIPNPAYCQDSDGKYSGANSYFENLVGKSVEEIKGKTVSEIIDPEIAKIEIEKDKLLTENQSMVNYELQLPDATGDLRELVISKSIFKNFDGSIAGIIGVINDITEKKRAEQALIESEKKLREANATKDKFFSIISHDMKNPFTTLLGFSEMLVDDYQEFDDEERKSFITEMRNVSRYSYKLLDNLLKWSKVQMGKLAISVEELDLCAIANEVILNLDDDTKKKNITLKNNIAKNLIINADRMVMNTIVQNLFANAIKFSKDGSSAEINAEKIDNEIIVSVIDRGIGIKEEDIPKLFRIDIHNVEIGKAKEKGTGLGLILCKEFVNILGGKIWVESKLDEGTKVSFSIALK